MKYDMSSSEQVIKLDGVSSNASSLAILADINLEINKGDFVAVLGKSGAGKTTLLRTIAGLHKPAKGDVLLYGQNFFSLGQKKRRMLRKRIGHIPQQFKLIKETSVFENVMVGRLGHIGAARSILRAYPKKDVDVVNSLIKRIGLEGKEHTYVKRLSGGEQQRVAIARCLAQDPDVILADEPMASLDVELAENILEILNSANKGGTTVICVLHDVEMALRYARRLVLLDRGIIVSSAPVMGIDENEIRKLFVNYVN